MIIQSFESIQRECALTPSAYILMVSVLQYIVVRRIVFSLFMACSPAATSDTTWVVGTAL